MRIPALLIPLLLNPCALQDAPKPAATPLFTNIAKELGLAGKPGGRAVFADVDGDGRVDCLLDMARLHLQRDGAWEDASERSKINARRQAQVILFGDVDNDGDLDCFSGRGCDFERIDPKTKKPAVADDGFRSEILLNDGKGVFTPVEKSGVEAHPATTVAAVFLDYDADGKLDLYVGNAYRDYGNTYNAYPSRLYRGRGDGRFDDVTEAVGMLGRDEPGHADSRRPVYGATHADWNNDGRQDILVCAYGRQWNQLWENRGERFVDAGPATTFDGDSDRTGKYTEEVKKLQKEKYDIDRSDESPFRANGNTFDCAVGDVDNDGDLDCFLAEITHWWAGPSSDLSSILWNEGAAKGWAFRRDSTSILRHHAEERWNQGDIHATWLDYDNDGRLDLLIASSDYPDRQELRLYRQADGLKFEEVTAAAGFDWEGAAQLSVADADRDGDLDILVGRSFHRLPPERTKDRIPEPAFFRNDVGSKNSWIALTLTGTRANRGAIGARVTVKSGGVTQLREVRGGEGHAGHQNPAEVFIGLGAAESADEIVVRWPDPDGTVQKLGKTAARARYALVQGGELKRVAP